MNCISLEGVLKVYGDKVVSDRVDLAVPEGAVYGLLGPNGAGKTTLIRMITRITKPDEGIIRFYDEEMTDNHVSQIGYMPEERGLYKKMKVGEHLVYLAALKGLKKVDAKTRITNWFDRLEIENWWDKKVEELSKGMQQKIQFIATVMHEPKLLILDEPFSGLDPVNTEVIRREIQRLNESGTTLIFSTHRMEQVEEICEHIALIDHGQKVLDGAVTEIKEQHKEGKYQLKFRGELPQDFSTHFNVLSTGKQQVLLSLDGKAPEELLTYLVRNKVDVQQYEEVLPSLNEVFIKQVNRDE